METVEIKQFYPDRMNSHKLSTMRAIREIERQIIVKVLFLNKYRRITQKRQFKTKSLKDEMVMVSDAEMVSKQQSQVVLL